MLSASSTRSEHALCASLCSARRHAIGDDPKLLDYARSILNDLRAHQVRAEIDESSDKINGKIQRAEPMKVHTMFVIGKRDMELNAVSVRIHGKGNLGAKPRAEAIGEILKAICERRT